MTPSNTPQAVRHAVDLIIRDLTDRGGLGNVWDEIDSSTQNEIKSTWTEIIIDVISKNNT